MNVRHTGKSIIQSMLYLLHRGYWQDKNIQNSLSVAEKKKLDTALQIKEFIDKIPGGFLIYSAEENEEIIYANDSLIKIFNCDDFNDFYRYTKGSFRGIVHAEELEAVEASIRKQISCKDGDVDNVDYRIIQKGGIVRWVEDYGQYVKGDDGHDYFYVFICDATEKITQRLMETFTLRHDHQEKEQKLHQLIEEYDKERKLIRQEHLQRLEVIEGLSVNYDSILYADFNANLVLPYRVSTRVQQQFEQKMQVREFEWFLQNYTNVWVHPEDRALFTELTSMDYIRKQLTKNRTYHLNYRCIENDEIKYIQLRIVNVGKNGDASQIVMGFQNVDEEVIKELKHKQVLETAFRTAKLAEIAKASFLSNMSHDMRTPLNAIFGYTAIAKKNNKDNLETLEALDGIETASRQILELIDKVLALTYMDAQAYSVNEEEGNVCDVVRSVYADALPKADKKGLRFTVDTSAVRNEVVLADLPKLTQVLTQIVSNAVLYTEHGEVKITVSERKSGVNEFATYEFIVNDTGIGMDEDFLLRVFDPFERAKNTTASGIYGTGLGLTIAKSMIEVMGGTITAHSELGKGSTFTVAVSLRTKEKSDCDGDENGEELTGKKILIVEDNPLNLEIETELLQDYGFIVDTAVNGQIAVDKIRAAEKDDYDLILMDIQMPVLDGRAASQAIRALDSELSGIPIIALSANAFDSDKILSLQAGINAHLNKPIDMPVLINAMQKAFSQRK